MTKALTWHVTQPGEILIGRHQVGHYDAGMKAVPGSSVTSLGHDAAAPGSAAWAGPGAYLGRSDG